MSTPESAGKGTRCGAEHPTNPTVVPCVLDAGHDADHFSTTGCAGSHINWPQDSIFDAIDVAYAAFRVLHDAGRCHESEWSCSYCEDLEQAWERGNNDGLTFAAAPQKSLLTNPYRYEPCVADAEGNCTRWSHDHEAGGTS